MDINDLRSLFTVLAFATFVGIVWWAYSSKRKSSFDAAANLALDEDEPAGSKDSSGRKLN
ncbi:MAG: cbb3-type cytochrome c oxidase subunit 3 [Rhodocyclaceae bacterium]|nr:cbb3-type cytochrome c oxidase subunit 3 [Rhodocyclaceae bacterium]